MSGHAASTTGHAVVESHVSRAKDPGIVASSQGIFGTISAIFMVIMLITMVWGIVSWIKTPTEKKVAGSTATTQSTPMPSVATTTPGEHRCITPCSVGIYWPFRIEGPGVKLEIDAPLKGGDRHTFVFEPEGKFDFSAEKDAKGNPFQIWKGEYQINTPDKPGMLVTIFEEER